jgi:hypothetical protein
LTSDTGAVGTGANPFDIDSSNDASGTVTALALGTVFLVETAGAMRVNTVRSQEDDVTLQTLAGDILDANDPLANNVTGRVITLLTQGGGVGTPGDALEVDTSNPTQGVLNIDASGSAHVTEVAGTLYAGQIDSETGDIKLSVRDSAAAGEDFVMASGSSVTALAAGGDVFIQAGDNVHLQAGSMLQANAYLTVHSGYGDTGNVDATGTT